MSCYSSLNFADYLGKFDTISLKMSLNLASLFFHGLVLLVGAEFSKHIVHLYSYNGAGELRQHLEVHSAHPGFTTHFPFFCGLYLWCPIYEFFPFSLNPHRLMPMSVV